MHLALVKQVYTCLLILSLSCFESYTYSLILFLSVTMLAALVANPW
jgi:hypothetical protein